MPAIAADAALIGRCGLYCGACRAFRDGRCRGCRANESCSWCKVGSCCDSRGLASCAECAEFPDASACRALNGTLPRLVGILRRSDRAACIARIRAIGYEAFAAEMAARGAFAIPPRRRRERAAQR